MRAKVWIAAMVAGTALVVLVGARHHTPPAPEVVVAPAEVPWLTREAGYEVVASDGGLGPLFAGVVLGGTPPLPEVRERIAEFARANDVTIDFEIVDDEVRAIRFEVMYSGCCGYEGADMLARRLMRPSTGGGCTGGEATWVDDWSMVTEEGVALRASVRVNRVLLRWEAVPTLDEVLTRADRMLGADRDVISREAGDRWSVLEAGKRYRIDVEHPAVGNGWYTWNSGVRYGDALGFEAVVEKGRVTEVAFAVREPHVSREAIPAALRAHWGRPRIRGEEWTWSRPDRTVRAKLGEDGGTTRFSLALR